MRLGPRWLVSTRYRTGGERGRELEREGREGEERERERGMQGKKEGIERQGQEQEGSEG